jgi:hypothetical protein
MNIRIAILEDNPFHFKQLSSLINSWALSAEHSIYILPLYFIVIQQMLIFPTFRAYLLRQIPRFSHRFEAF